RHPGQRAAVVAPVATACGLDDVRPAVAGHVADDLLRGAAGCRSQLLSRHAQDLAGVGHHLEIAAAGDVAEGAVAFAAVLLGGEARDVRAVAGAVAVARAHRVALAAPEVLLAVAVEVQARDPARDQRTACDVMAGLAAGHVLEGAAAVAAVVPQARGRAPVAVRD